MALFSVKSFGTENRKATNKVPERNEIYEYIVFRGSDIDDLHVAAAPNDNKQGQVAEDPAIVQVMSMNISRKLLTLKVSLSLLNGKHYFW